MEFRLAELETHSVSMGYNLGMWQIARPLSRS
jgi:hypothetical protein